MTAGDHVLAYVRAQRDAIVELDPAVRQDVEDSVHSMRVATRRMRSTFKSYGKVLDRDVTDPIGDELKWLAGELGVDRDREVLTERLTAALGRGAAHAGLTARSPSGWALGERPARRGARPADRRPGLPALPRPARHPGRGDRRPAAAEGGREEARQGDPQGRTKDFGKVSGARRAGAGAGARHRPGRRVHEARKKTKRTRYAAEAATPALGKPAKDLAKSMKSLQNLLGEHQDSVMARETLRELSAVAHAAGESAFTYGLLYGREEQRAAAVEAELPGFWDGIVAEGSLQG